MNLKRTTFSYLTWIVLLFFSGVSCAFFALVLGQTLKVNIVLIAAGLVTIFFGIIYLTYVLSGRFIKKGKDFLCYPGMDKLIAYIENMALIAMLSIGLVLRVLLISTAQEEASYFDVSKVTEQGTILINAVQGSVYFYCLLLHALFRIFGNHWIAGIWLQIFLQLSGALILFVGLKRILRKLIAYIALSGILFTPACIRAGLTYSPQQLYFCVFATAFLCITLLLYKNESKRAECIIHVLLAGILTGVACYVDITGFLLLIPIVCVSLLKDETHAIKPIFQMIITLMVVVITLFSALLVDSILSNTTISNVLHAWKIIYGSTNFDFNTLSTQLSIEFVIFAIFSAFGCASFWRRKETDVFTPFVWMTAGSMLLVFTGITTDNMTGIYLMQVLLMTLAILSVIELFHKEKFYDLREEELEIERENIKVDTNNKEIKVEYIENPLPVPKKHVRKTMDYAFIPSEAQMKYDILVSDKDDFDLK